MDIDPSVDSSPSHGHSDDTLIWGTSISAKATLESFRSFLLNYSRPEDNDHESMPYYIRLLQEVRALSLGFTLFLHLIF